MKRLLIAVLLFVTTILAACQTRTINRDPAVRYEQAAYAIWLSPQKDRMEAVIEGQSKYGKMTIGNMEKLLPILESS